jgi:ribosome maturation factor RimP
MDSELSSLWEIVKGVALEEGVELFDIDFPSDARRGGVLRVYITRANTERVGGAPAVEESPAVSEDGASASGASSEAQGRGGISFEDCVRVSKRLLDLDEQQELIPEHCNLEVSSPGVNRRLRLPQHFRGAVGERVRVKYRSESTGITQVLCGHVVDADEQGFSLEGEAKKDRISIAFNEVKEARVDFKF